MKVGWESGAGGYRDGGVQGNSAQAAVVRYKNPESERRKRTRFCKALEGVRRFPGIAN